MILKRKLRDVQCARLDVHELARDGKLTLGNRGRLFGTIWFEVTGGPDAQRLVLEFPCKSASGNCSNPLRQVICCYWRRAHYGGRYLMFLCSECGRSARVLYARYFSDRIWFFGCRKCAGITYQSTMGHRWDRSARRIEKLRARLQWRDNGTEPIRPRGMHERTYQRILGTRLPRGCSKTGRELRSQIQARSAPRSSVAAVPKQVWGAWWMAGPLTFCGEPRPHSVGLISAVPEGILVTLRSARSLSAVHSAAAVWHRWRLARVPAPRSGSCGSSARRCSDSVLRGCTGNRVEVIEPLVMRRGHPNEIPGGAQHTQASSQN